MSVMGHKQTSRDVRVTSALPPIEDIRRMSWHVRLMPTADISRSGKPRRHSAGGSPQPNSLPLGQGSQVYRFVLDVIEVTCAGVTELPSVEDARHC